MNKEYLNDFNINKPPTTKGGKVGSQFIAKEKQRCVPSLRGVLFIKIYILHLSFIICIEITVVMKVVILILIKKQLKKLTHP